MDIATILTINYPETIWTLNGDNYSGLEWLDETPKPTEKELKTQWADIQHQIVCKAVSAARHASYIAPNGSDSVFMKYQRGEASKQEWLDAVKAINDANPYPVA
jgi:hypothetical protein